MLLTGTVFTENLSCYLYESYTMWPLLRKKIGWHIQLLPEQYDIVESFFTARKYRRRQFILQEGDVCRYETFILKGCCRTYHTDENGQEHILQFGLEGWWVGELRSFINETPAMYNIECMEDCEVLHITRINLEKLYATVPAMERFFRILIQNGFIAFQQRVSVMLSRPAAERYQDFIGKYPHIDERVPNHMIASYLGITPQSLSRIRSGYRNKKR